MQIDIHPEKKLVCIWLTKAESADISAQEQLRPLYDKFRKQKFLVAVFRSGNQKLTDLTSELLRYNRKLFAEREVRAGKESA